MAARYDFSLDQGADFLLPLVLKDGTGKELDLYGFSFAAQVRRRYERQRLVDTLTQNNGRITVEGARVTLDYPHAVTEGFCPGALSYDVEMTAPGGRKTRVIEGIIMVSGEVTKDV